MESKARSQWTNELDQIVAIVAAEVKGTRGEKRQSILARGQMNVDAILASYYFDEHPKRRLDLTVLHEALRVVLGKR